MNKAQLISTLASTTNLTRRDADVAVNSIFNLIIEQLRQGDKVQIVGFGCFEVRERPARKGRNPRPVRLSISMPPVPLLSSPASPLKTLWTTNNFCL